MRYLNLGLLALSFLSSQAVAQPADCQIPRVASASVPVLVAASPAPQKAVEEWTDFFFYRLYPQLGRRKIRAGETQYIKEWRAIAEVIRSNSLVYENNPCGGAPRYQWLLSKYDGQGRNGIEFASPVLNRVADAVFYARHPELGNRKIKPGETALAAEWQQIRRTVSEFHPCD